MLSHVLGRATGRRCVRRAGRKRGAASVNRAVTRRAQCAAPSLTRGAESRVPCGGVPSRALTCVCLSRHLSTQVRTVRSAITSPRAPGLALPLPLALTVGTTRGTMRPPELSWHPEETMLSGADCFIHSPWGGPLEKCSGFMWFPLWPLCPHSPVQFLLCWNSHPWNIKITKFYAKVDQSTR